MNTLPQVYRGQQIILQDTANDEDEVPDLFRKHDEPYEIFIPRIHLFRGVGNLVNVNCTFSYFSKFTAKFPS